MRPGVIFLLHPWRTARMDSEAAAAAARSPLVFQCRGCRSILGDSLTWVAAEETIQAIALKGTPDPTRTRWWLMSARAVAPGVKVLSEFDTARSGADAGSSFMPLACNFCDVRVGRVYQTTPQTLDHLRQQFTLHTDKITRCRTATAGFPVVH